MMSRHSLMQAREVNNPGWYFRGILKGNGGFLMVLVRLKCDKLERLRIILLKKTQKNLIIAK